MLMCCLQMKRWLSAILSCSSVELTISRSHGSGLVSRLINKIATILSTCIFALGGAMIGSVAGAIKGQTTETGMLRGVGVGGVAGAITGVQLFELIINGEPFSKVALICSLLNGKLFREWLSHSVLEAYDQWQISDMESSNFMIVEDIFEVSAFAGLPTEVIKELPIIEYESNMAETRRNCAVCFQDVMDGECTRLLPSCGHLFHIHCIDEWLTRRPTCPLCRQHVGYVAIIN